MRRITSITLTIIFLFNSAPIGPARAGEAALRPVNLWETNKNDPKYKAFRTAFTIPIPTDYGESRTSPAQAEPPLENAANRARETLEIYDDALDGA